MLQQRSLELLLAASIVCGAAGISSADPLSLRVEGTIASVDQDLLALVLPGLTASIGDSFHASATFTPGPDTWPDETTVGGYEARAAMTLAVGASSTDLLRLSGMFLTLAGSPGGVGFPDRDALSFFGDVALQGSQIAFFSINAVGDFLDSDAATVENLSTPSGVLSLAIRSFDPRIPFEHDPEFAPLRMQVDSIVLSAPSANPVPEPGTLALIALGLVGFGAHRVRQRKA